MRTLLVSFLISLSLLANAQDNIYLKTGDVISASEILISKNVVTFKRADRPDREFEVPTANVLKIAYRSGVTETFGLKTDSVAKSVAPVVQPSATIPNTATPAQAAPNAAVIAPAQPAPSNLPITTGTPFTTIQLLSADIRTEDYKRGFRDGNENYRDYQGATIATILTTVFISPLYAIPVPLFTSISKPPLHRIAFIPAPDNTNLNYVAGYRNGAAKKKSNRIWRAYGITSGIYVGTVLVAFIALVSAVSRGH